MIKIARFKSQNQEKRLYLLFLSPCEISKTSLPSSQENGKKRKKVTSSHVFADAASSRFPLDRNPFLRIERVKTKGTTSLVNLNDAASATTGW